MVIKDIYNDQKKNPNSHQFSMASPTDRLLAGFLDLMFHVPIFTLITSLVLYRLSILRLTVATVSEKLAVVTQVVWIVVVGSVILQGIYLKLWGKTPGMKLLKLELRSTVGEPPTWGQCLLRSFFWSLQLLFLGIPLLEIFSHQKRHALHDRISETEIVSEKVWGSHPPLASERASINFVFISILMLFLGWFTAFFSGTQQSVQDGSLATMEWREQERLCSQVDETAKYAGLTLKNLEDRLDLATSLFLFEQVDEECFRNEVNLAVIKEVPTALVPVGQALLSHYATEEKQAYLESACKMDGRWCLRSLLKEKGSEKEIRELLRDGTVTSNHKDSLTYLTSKVILLNRLGAADKASVLINELQNRGVRATGLAVEQVRAVGHRFPDRSPSILEALQSVMTEKDYVRMSAELCLQELEKGCGTKVHECTILVRELPKYQEMLDDLVVGRALFKEASCKKDFSESLDLWSQISNENLQKLVGLALQAERAEVHGSALSLLRQFVKDESIELVLRFDALQLLVSHSQLVEDWSLVPKIWSQFHWTSASYLSASEWLLRVGAKDGRSKVIQQFAATFQQIPGLKMDYDLLYKRKLDRVPASLKKGGL